MNKKDVKPVLPPYNRVFGGTLHFLRRQTKMSLYQMGEYTSINPGQLSRIENGSQPPPSDKTIKKIAARAGQLSRAGLFPERKSQALSALKQAKTVYGQPGLPQKQIADIVQTIEEILGASIEFIPEVQLIRAGTVCTGMSSSQQWITGSVEMCIKDPKTGTLVSVQCILQPSSGPNTESS